MRYPPGSAPEPRRYSLEMVCEPEVAVVVVEVEEAGVLEEVDGEAAAAGLLVVGVEAPTACACAASIGVSSDCWITFTPSGLLHADSRVRAL